jgi:chitin disaccharide deacetylase
MSLAAAGRRGRREAVFGLLTVCVLGSAVALDRTLPLRKERYVVINSDDAGLFPSVNQATIDAMERGIVSSCSIRVDGPAFKEFARYAAAHPEKDFGVHLSLNCEKDTGRWGPVLGHARVPSLVGPDGFLWRRTWESAAHAKIDEVEAELRAQIELCRSAGIRLSHLDHNMFVLYRRPDFIRLYVRLGLEYDLPIRYSFAAPGAEDLDPDDPELVRAYEEGLRTLQSRGMPIFKTVEVGNYDVPPRQKRQYYFDVFRRLSPGVSEILMHCAYVPSSPPSAPGADRRQADTHVFMSQDTADALARQGIRVITWRAFRQMHAQGLL